jgi:hypothetical protein
MNTFNKIVWMLGNLARASYVGSSDFVWPYSYNQCNQRNRHSQEINACSAVNHYGLQPFTGRGSPEIDILESMQGEAGKLPSTFIQRPYQSTSLQVAPGIEIDRPMLGLRPEKVGSYHLFLDRKLISFRDCRLQTNTFTLGTLVFRFGIF